MRYPLQTVVPMTAISVGTVLTPVMAARDLSGAGAILLAFLNDGADLVTVRVDTSEDGALFDQDQVYQLPISPGTQRSLIFDGNLRRYYRASATSQIGTNSVRYWVRAELRANVGQPTAIIPR